MEVLWFLRDNWGLVLAVIVLVIVFKVGAEIDMNGVSKALRKSEEARKKAERELDKHE